MKFENKCWKPEFFIVRPRLLPPSILELFKIVSVLLFVSAFKILSNLSGSQ